MSTKKIKILIQSKTGIFQYRNILKKNLKNYLKTKITLEERKKQPKTLYKKTIAFIKRSKNRFHRFMFLKNYTANTKFLNKDYPLFLEMRITMITTNFKELDNFKKTAATQHDRLLNIFHSYKLSIEKGKLKNYGDEEQLTINETLNKSKTIINGIEYKEISEGEVTIPLDYYNKYVRIKSPNFGEKEYLNNDIEKLAREKKEPKMIVDQKGRIFIKKFYGIKK